MLTIGYDYIDMMYQVDQSKPCAQKPFQKIACCINLQLPILFFVKSIISDMHHHIKTYMKSIFSKIILDQSKPYNTNHA